jgi:hypothetical protein
LLRGLAVQINADNETNADDGNHKVRDFTHHFLQLDEWTIAPKISESIVAHHNAPGA